MKVLKTLIAVALVGLTASLVRAEGDGRGKGGEGKHQRGPGQMMEHLMPPFLLEDLKLTAEQKAKYDELETAFKKDAQALQEKRKASMDTIRAMLTDEQKAKLEAAKEKMRERHGDKEGKGPKGPPPGE